MTLAVAAPRKALKGHAQPRVAPPQPARSQWKEFRDLATKLGIELFPWQETAARYLTALGHGDRWLYREVAIIVARQNGKTTLLVPLVVGRLLAGQKIMHTAQNAKLPREIHEQVATLFQAHFPEMLPKKRAISYALGHEEINLVNGAKYRIVAPTRDGARGPSVDMVIIDELRQMVDHGFIAAAKPTLTASTKPQMIYLSNAGTEGSEVLNAVKARGEADPALAYLEWSAEPGRPSDDLEGWAQANPALGHKPDILQTLYDDHRADLLGGTLAVFETEHLCRWVVTMRERLVQEFAWLACRAEDALPKPTSPVMGISMDPSGERASAAIAWRMGELIGLRMVYDVPGDPIDTDTLGKDLRKSAREFGVRKVAFDPLTDGELAKFFTKPEPVSGSKYANASARFATAVKANIIQWADAEAVTSDLVWTAKKPHDESGSYQAVRANDDRPITAVLAAIRAVWLASGPRPPRPKVM